MVEADSYGYNQEFSREELLSTVSNETESNASPQEKPPILRFHERVQSLGAYDALDERRRALMNTYFTQEISLASLVQRGEATSETSARYLLYTGLESVFEHLPQTCRQNTSVQKRL
jgi:hypothetical protein